MKASDPSLKYFIKPFAGIFDIMGVRYIAGSYIFGKAMPDDRRRRSCY
jgi:hypothetical protein